MSDFIYCPKCTVLLELNGTCSSCRWKPEPAPNSRKAPANHVAPPPRKDCGWNDRGSICQHEALIEGRCRQHAGMRGCIGNRLPPMTEPKGEWLIAMDAYKRNPKTDYPTPPNTPDMAYGTRKWHEEMKTHRDRGGSSILYDQHKDDLPALETLVGSEPNAREPGQDC